MTRYFLAAFLALMLPVSAMADGAFWTGGALGGAGSGGVSSSATLSLDVNTKLIFDADATANDAIYSSSDGVMRIAPDNTIVWTVGSTFARFATGKTLQIGDGANYWHIYNSAVDYQFKSTNCDGGGADCYVWKVDDGDAIFDLRNDEFFHNEQDGKITLGGGGGTNDEDLVLDFETSANTIEITSNTSVSLVDFNSLGVVAFAIYSGLYNAPTGILQGGFEYDATQDDVLFTNSATYGNQWIFGPGASRAKDFDHVPQTNPTIFVHSDNDPDLGNTEWLSLAHDQTDGVLGLGTGDLKIAGTGATLTLGHDATYSTIKSNDVDGILLGTTGGSFDETLLIDFDFASNFIDYSSTSGATVHQFNSFLRVPTGGGFFWATKTELTSDADGQLQIEQSDNTVGVTLDANDAADTLTIKDQAGTGLGNLSVTGASKRGHIVLDCTDDGYTVPATVHHITVETGTGACTGNMDITLPAVACTPATAQDDCRVIDILRIGAVQVDIGGDSGTETINGSTTYSLTSSYQGATLLETNSTSTDWTVR